ncbi:MAG: replication-relaxation family protein [Oscillospiraceae bacterium]|nr:replication-relaxation family protein [Oscillospiraceae bacterium]
MSAKGLQIQERDLDILRLVHRFRFCLSRHIKVLCGFDGARAANRRLKMLVDAGYLERKKYLYGISEMYTLSHKGRILLGVNKREDKIRLDRITHDIYVLDSVVYFCLKYGISFAAVQSEKELHIQDGFCVRKHQPDFAVEIAWESIAVEVELNPKAKIRMGENIRENYLKYDKQIWITNNNKVFSLLGELKNEYSNIDVIRLEEVLEYVKSGYS